MIFKRRIFCPKAMDLILFLKENKDKRLFKSQIVSLMDSDKSYTEILFAKFKMAELINIEREGGRVYVTLSEKGNNIADHLIKMGRLLKNNS